MRRSLGLAILLPFGVALMGCGEDSSESGGDLVGGSGGNPSDASITDAFEASTTDASDASSTDASDASPTDSNTTDTLDSNTTDTSDSSTESDACEDSQEGFPVYPGTFCVGIDPQTGKPSSAVDSPGCEKRWLPDPILHEQKCGAGTPFVAAMRPFILTPGLKANDKLGIRTAAEAFNEVFREAGLLPEGELLEILDSVADKNTVAAYRAQGRPFISLGATSVLQDAANHDLTASEKTSAISLPYDGWRVISRNGNLYIFGRDVGYTSGERTSRNGFSRGTANGVYDFLEECVGARWLLPGSIGLDVPKANEIAIGAIDYTGTHRFAARVLSSVTTDEDIDQTAIIEKWRAALRQDGPVKIGANHAWWQVINRGYDKNDDGIQSGPFNHHHVDGPNNDNVKSDAVKSAYKAHPGWFALVCDENGNNCIRKEPTTNHDKLESTHPEVQQFFADQANVECNDLKPFSLSPSDGSKTFSMSPESNAFLGEVPKGHLLSGRTLRTPLVLDWYEQVIARADTTCEVVPGKPLMFSGFLYSEYRFPPLGWKSTGAYAPKALSASFVPFYVENGGYSMLRPDVRKVMVYNLCGWESLIPSLSSSDPRTQEYRGMENKEWYYYGNNFQLFMGAKSEVGGKDRSYAGSSGMVTPVATDAIDFLFALLLETGVSGIDHIYGARSFSNAGLSNYVIARKMIEPERPALDIRDEWIERAYGSAAAGMKAFYDQLIVDYSTYYNDPAWQSNDDQDENIDDPVEDENETGTKGPVQAGVINCDLLHELVNKYPQWENLFLSAAAQLSPEEQAGKQGQRLSLLRMNLQVLAWRLHQVDDAFTAQLAHDDATVDDLLSGRFEHDRPIEERLATSFELFPELTNTFQNDRNFKWDELPNRLPPIALVSSVGSNKGVLPAPLSSDKTVLIYFNRPATVVFEVSNEMKQSPHMATYEVHDKTGLRVGRGLLYAGAKIELNGARADAFTITFTLRKGTNFKVDSSNNAYVGDYKVATNELRLLDHADQAVGVLYPHTRLQLTENQGRVSIRMANPKDTLGANKFICR